MTEKSKKKKPISSRENYASKEKEIQLLSQRNPMNTDAIASLSDKLTSTVRAHSFISSLIRWLKSQ